MKLNIKKNLKKNTCFYANKNIKKNIRSWRRRKRRRKKKMMMIMDM
jgi:hypothetical protein